MMKIRTIKSIEDGMVIGGVVRVVGGEVIIIPIVGEKGIGNYSVMFDDNEYFKDDYRVKLDDIKKVMSEDYEMNPNDFEFIDMGAGNFLFKLKGSEIAIPTKKEIKVGDEKFTLYISSIDRDEREVLWSGFSDKGTYIEKWFPMDN